MERLNSMYINGRKITIEELQQLANKLIGTLLNDLYDQIQEKGLKEGCPYPKKQQKAALSKMMEFYIEQEEYEKCAVVRDILKKLK